MKINFRQISELVDREGAVLFAASKCVDCGGGGKLPAAEHGTVQCDECGGSGMVIEGWWSVEELVRLIYSRAAPILAKPSLDDQELPVLEPDDQIQTGVAKP